MIKKLTAEQAIEVVERLSGKGGKIQEAVLAEARDALSEIDLDETADEVFFVLDSIDVQDCWDRAGSSRNGYTSPDEAAVEIMEERLQPYLDQTRRYHELDMPGEEMTHCMGLILGIYRYEHESKSEFREWSVDIPVECAGALLCEWRERGQGLAFAEGMDEFLQQRCPNWARHLLRTADLKRAMDADGAGKHGTAQDIASAGRCPTQARYTIKQGQYLAFIYYYTKIHGRSPSEADMQSFFKVSPPAVHQMVLSLERLGFIERTPGQARSLKLLLNRKQLPDLM